MSRSDLHIYLVHKTYDDRDELPGGLEGDDWGTVCCDAIQRAFLLGKSSGDEVKVHFNALKGVVIYSGGATEQELNDLLNIPSWEIKYS